MGMESKFVCVTVEHIIVGLNSPAIHLKIESTIQYVYRQIFSFDFYLGFFKGISKFRLFYTKNPLIPNSSEDGLYRNLSSYWLAQII